MDLSGLTSDGKYLYAISDLSDQNDIFRIELKPKPALVKVMQLDSNWLNEWYSRILKVVVMTPKGLLIATVSFIWLKKALVLFWKLGLVVTFIGRLA